MELVAQLVEHQIVTLGVESSILSFLPKKTVVYLMRHELKEVG